MHQAAKLARVASRASRPWTAVAGGHACMSTSAAGPTVAIAGVTGAVGQDILQVLDERKFPVGKVKMLASSRSAGKKQSWRGEEHTIEELTPDSFGGVDIAFFSAGGSQSLAFAPAAAAAGAVVVDNSSAFRMTDGVPLVIPEINPTAVNDRPKGIIANPNCSTIIMAVPVWPLHVAAGVTRMSVSTYQAASGAGAAAMRELEQQAHDWASGKVGKELTQDIFGRQYLWNVFSHNSAVDSTTGYNEEELKMVLETAKIFGSAEVAGDSQAASSLPAVTATCIRVPVLRAHCEAINLTLASPLSAEKAREILAGAPGVTIVDDREANKFPEPLDASDQDDILVGRLRGDVSQAPGLGLEMFVSGDQVRKGAATNAVQIAELLL